MRARIAPYLKPTSDEQGSNDAVNGDHVLNASRPSSVGAKRAAVLVPIVEHPTGPTVLLTKRTDHLRGHAGQVSFPGGGAEPEDAGPVDTALREAHEEVGLTHEHIDVIGLLDNYQTGTNYLVTPVVGIVRPGVELTIDTFEVADTFEVPLDFLFDPSNHAIESREWNDSRRYYYVFRYDGFFIWGATAGMLMNLYRRLHGLAEPD
jgi:8-oxo-dGTP pyrophosphatase MutT (NUDIX family)